MKYNYVDSIDSEKGIVTMLLHGEIGNEISGAGFARELKQIVDHQSSLKKINVSINSPGGMVFDGYSIITAIDYAKANGIEVDTHIDGLAASMAAVIAVNGDKVFCADYGSVMIHNPFDADAEASQDVTKLFKDSLVAIMSGKTGIDKVEMSTMMDKETWMTPAQARKKKFVDEIKPTQKRLSIPNNSTPAQIYAFYNSALKDDTKKEDVTIKTPNMKNVAAKLKINADSNETAFENAIDTLIAEASTSKGLLNTITAERDALKLKVTAFEAAEVTAKTKEIDTLVDTAIEEGKIKKEDREIYIGFAKVDFENTKKVIGGIAKDKKGVSVLDKAKKDGAVAAPVAGREKWTIRDWEKQDAKGLAEIKKSTPEVFQEMHDAFYKEVTARQDEKRS